MIKIFSVLLYIVMFEDSYMIILMRDKCFYLFVLKVYFGNKICDFVCFLIGVRKYFLWFYEKVFYLYWDMLLIVVGFLCFVI